HPAYQHPHRFRDQVYSADVDRFSHLVIYAAFRALADRGRDLWDRHGDPERLLFSARDFEDPKGSALLRELWAAPEPLPTLAGRVALAAAGPLAAVPHLDELIDGDTVRPLTIDEWTEAEAMLGAVKPPPRPTPP